MNFQEVQQYLLDKECVTTEFDDKSFTVLEYGTFENKLENAGIKEDLEVINYTENKDTAYVDMVVNDRGAWDKLSDRQFRTLTDKINDKAFNTYKMEYYIVVDQDPTGIVYNKTNTPNVDKDLSNIVKEIQKYLKELTT